MAQGNIKKFRYSSDERGQRFDRRPKHYEKKSYCMDWRNCEED